jgi:hypothetical protein
MFKLFPRSLVVEHLLDNFSTRAGVFGPTSAVAFFYCDYRQQSSQTTADFMATCLRQLLIQRRAIPESVLNFYKLYRSDGFHAQTKELLHILKRVCSEFQHCYFVIDAIDETGDGGRGKSNFGRSQRKAFLSTLQELERTGVKLFITTRPHTQGIHEAFPKASQIEICARDEDVERFVLQTIEDDDNMRDIMGDSLKEEVCKALTKRARGM